MGTINYQFDPSKGKTTKAVGPVVMPHGQSEYKHDPAAGKITRTDK